MYYLIFFLIKNTCKIASQFLSKKLNCFFYYIKKFKNPVKQAVCKKKTGVLKKT